MGLVQIVLFKITLGTFLTVNNITLDHLQLYCMNSMGVSQKQGFYEVYCLKSTSYILVLLV